jgi:hypothetical protein
MMRMPKILPTVLGGGCGIFVGVIVLMPSGRLWLELGYRGIMAVVVLNERCCRSCT